MLTRVMLMDASVKSQMMMTTELIRIKDYFDSLLSEVV